MSCGRCICRPIPRAHRVPPRRARPVGPVVPAAPTCRSRPARWPSPPVIVGIMRLLAGDGGQDDPDRVRPTTSCRATWPVCRPLGAVPRKGVYDNEGALVSRRGGKANLDRALPALPRDARHGGRGAASGRPRVQGGGRTPQRLSRDELPPRPRFSSPADFNAQLTEWLVRANRRVHATLRCRPVDRFEEDKAAMMAAPAGPARHRLRLSTAPRPVTTRCGSGPATTRSTRR